MTATYKVTFREFRTLIEKLPGRMNLRAVKAQHKTAEFGRTAVQKVARQSKPAPYATGTYQQGWVATKLRTGATLDNTTTQAYFVEVGRRPGKMPPIKPIRDWVEIKFGKKSKKRKARGAKKGPDKGGDKGPKKGKGQRKAKGPRQAKQPPPDLDMLALLIARKIGNKGYEGRYVLKRTIPLMHKYLLAETKRQLRKMHR